MRNRMCLPIRLQRMRCWRTASATQRLGTLRWAGRLIDGQRVRSRGRTGLWCRLRCHGSLQQRSSRARLPGVLWEPVERRRTHGAAQDFRSRSRCVPARDLAPWVPSQVPSGFCSARELRLWRSFSIAKTSTTWPDLPRAAHLGVTVLADHHGEVCRQLAGPVEPRFEGIDVNETDSGAHTHRGTGMIRHNRLPRRRGGGPHHRLAAAARRRTRQGQPLVFHRSSLGRLATC